MAMDGGIVQRFTSIGVRLIIAMAVAAVIRWSAVKVFFDFRKAASIHFFVKYPFWGSAVEPVVTGVLVVLLGYFIIGQRVALRVRWVPLGLALVGMAFTAYCGRGYFIPFRGVVWAPLVMQRIFDGFYTQFLTGLLLVLALLRPAA